MSLYKHAAIVLLQKQKGCFNPTRVISVTTSTPDKVHTSSSVTLLVHYKSPIQLAMSHTTLYSL